MSRVQDDLNEVMGEARKSTEGAAGTERWLISYADSMTLLLAFFIMMYAIPQVNKFKLEGFEQSMTTAFWWQVPVVRVVDPNTFSTLAA